MTAPIHLCYSWTMSNEVFICKFHIRGKGIKIITKSDRKRLIECLDGHAQRLRNESLKAVLEDILVAKYANRPDLSSKMLGNVGKYITGDAGIGLALLIDVAQYLGLKLEWKVTMPNKLSSLIIYD